MLLKSIILVSLCVAGSYGVRFDYYTSEPVTKNQLRFYESQNISATCTIDIKPCDENEWRRHDGSCNNLKHVARGTYFGTMDRILPSDYYNGSYQRKAKSGNDLPLARYVRTMLLPEGMSSSSQFTNNIPGYSVLLFLDIGSVHDVNNMLTTTTHCCEKEHMHDYACTPNIVPGDDPVHRFSGIRCMNSTRPLTYQDFYCTSDSEPSPIKKATAEFDASCVYSMNNEGGKAIRSYSNGQIAMIEKDGKIFPPGGPTATCLNNAANETLCFENFPNTLLPVVMLIIWFARHHNYIANELAKVNPCWDDDMLFETARDINIAFSQQIHLYEWLLNLEGRENLIKAGIICEDGGFRNLYNENEYPRVFLEYNYILRAFHLWQETRAKMYDGDGNLHFIYPLTNATFRPGLLGENNNMEYFTQSTFRAGCHAQDGTVDPDMGNRAFPGVQLSIDAPAGDLNKGRHFGLPPYVDYVRYFTGVEITCFEDLAEFIREDKIQNIKDVYECPEDLDVLAAVWLEKPIEGGNIGRVFSEIINYQTYKAITSDRYWFELPDRPHAYTKPQLAEIRKASLSLLLCTVGDGVREITRNSFRVISPENPLVKCSEIEKMDFSAWADESCNKSDC